MLHTPLALCALLAAPHDPALPALDLIHLVPNDAWLIGSVDAQEIGAKGLESAWYRFFKDPRTLALLEELSEEEFDLDAALEEEGLADLKSLFTDVRSGVFFLTAFSPEMEAPKIGFVLEALEDVATLEPWLAKSVTDYAEQSSTTEDGVRLTTLRTGVEGEPEFAVQFSGARHAGVLYAESAEKAEAIAKQLVDRIASQGAGGQTRVPATMQQGRASLAFDPALELLVDAGPMLSSIPETEEGSIERVMSVAASALHGAYIGARIGEGEELDLNASVHFAEDSLLGDLAALVGPTPVELLELAPKSVLNVSASSFDLVGFADMVLDLIATYAPEMEGEVESGLAMAEAQLGAHPIDDILGAFSGDFVSFMSKTPEGSSIQDMVLGSMFGTNLMGLEEGHGLDTLVEDLIPMFEGFVPIEITEHAGHDVFSISGDGMSVHWTISDDFMAYSSDNQALNATLTRATTDAEGLSIFNNERLAPALTELEDKQGFWIMDTALSLEFLMSMFEAVRSEQTGSSNGGEAGWERGYFSGTIRGVTEVTAGSLRLVVRGR